MRIVHVCADPGIPVWGAKGASIHVQEMLRALTRRGARVTLLTSRAEGDRPADLAGVEVVALPPATKGDPEIRARALLSANAEVTALLDRLQPDLVYERHALYAHAAMEWAATNGQPSILEVNAPLLEEQAAHRHLALPEEAEASVRRAMRSASLVSAVSPPVVDHSLAIGARRAVCVPNGIDPARFPAPGPRPDRPFTVGFLGSLKPWHGLPTLIDAFALLRAEHPTARLLIVGDGPERAATEARLRAADAHEAARFTGLLSAADVPGALSDMDVGTAPYGASEAFYFSPLKIYEYMAAGLPVVASRTGHLAELVEDGRTGLIVPPDAPRALADALSELAAGGDAARAMGAAGRARVLADHTWAGVAERVLTLALSSDRDAA